MPERTIKTSAAFYKNEDGVSVLGQQGEKVNVHADDVARFDKFNVLPERFIDEPAGMDDDLVYGRTEAELREQAEDEKEDEKPRTRSSSRKS
ncbi:hypothetical protein A5646_03505 [Mycobacterium sp. 1245499.0]|uniref:hypothetical protein n=1 Tax=Mycobacterium sp. 1245499.0 TaxID=1834074 RepID=UPI0007FF7310|nr:hypothetical protein [Mycobacterium sp. 1245499.0]OBK92380.1 hypothetical protein A5646_03505 [Mycobacterium sp. 1245499.0]